MSSYSANFILYPVDSPPHFLELPVSFTPGGVWNLHRSSGTFVVYRPPKNMTIRAKGKKVFADKGCFTLVGFQGRLYRIPTKPKSWDHAHRLWEKFVHPYVKRDPVLLWRKR